LLSYSENFQQFIETVPPLQWSQHRPFVSTFSQINPQIIYLSWTLILSTHLRSVLPSVLVSLHFGTEMCYFFIFSQICPARHTSLIHLVLIIIIIYGKEYKLWSYSLASCLQYPVSPSLLSQNILFSTQFWCIFSMCSFLNTRVNDSQPYKTTGKLQICLNILSAMFLDSRGDDKRFSTA
jgi:hypothetical protein